MSNAHIEGILLTDKEPAVSASRNTNGKDPQSDAIVVDGLIFKPGQLIRLQLEASNVASEEEQFANLVAAFLQKAHAGRQAINAESDKLQVTSFRLSEFHNMATTKQSESTRRSLAPLIKAPLSSRLVRPSTFFKHMEPLTQALARVEAKSLPFFPSSCLCCLAYL